MSLDEFDSVIAAARTGAEWALTMLYRDLQPKLLRYLFAQEPRVAEDIASEAWIDVARGLGRFDGDQDGFRAWVFTIARRRLLDFRRKTLGRKTTPMAPEGLESLAREGDAEDDALEALGTESALARIAALPPDQAEVVLLRVLGGLQVSDVAEIVGKRPGAVRALQHRALRQLARTVSREAVTE
jgi:RNA polymerase sigma-70 factor (ECF subfamily)